MKNNVIDIEAKLPHEVCEVMCLYCGQRWIAVFPETTPLKSLHCLCCKRSGGVFKTGQTLNEDDYLKDKEI